MRAATKPMPRPRKFPPPEPPSGDAERGADYVQSFAPSLGDQCHTLILGSMPGAASLAAVQYYAHPRNLFWPLMQALYAVPRELPYAQRLARLHEAGVGLWDVLQGCKRRGSLDSAIARVSEVPNAVAELLRRRPQICTVGLNGAKAAQAFRRHVAAHLCATRASGLAVLELPSTSPAHASMSGADKLAAWSALRRAVARDTRA